MSWLSDQFDDIADWVNDQVGDASNYLSDQLGDIWREGLEPIVEETLKYLGVEDRTVVSTAVISQRVITDTDEETNPDFVKDRIYTALALEHQRDPDGRVIEHMQQLANTASSKFIAAYTYGKTDYYNGLPTCNINTSSVDKSIVKTALDTLKGIDSIIVYSELRLPTYEEYAKYHLQEDYGYTPHNNEVTRDSHVYSVDSIEYNELTNGVYIKLISNDIIWTVSLPARNSNKYYCTKYSVDDEWSYWLYSKGEGTHPTLDNLTTAITSVDMMPVLTIRNSGKSINRESNQETDEYKDSVSMARKIGMSLDTITEGIEASEDIDNVKDAFVHYALSPMDATKATSEALYRLFDDIVLYSDLLDISDLEVGCSTVIGENAIATAFNHLFGITCTVANRQYIMNFKEDKMNLSVVWKDQYRDSIVGSIGIVGTYNHEIVDISNTLTWVSNNSTTTEYMRTITMTYADETTQVNNTHYTATHTYIGSEDPTYSSSDITMVQRVTERDTTYTENTENSSVTTKPNYDHLPTEDTTDIDNVLAMQYQDNVNSYSEIQITSLTNITLIKRAGHIGIVGSDVKDTNFFIPISYSAMSELTPIERAELLSAALRITIYASETQHLNYYEGSRFTALVEAVGILIIIVTSIFTWGGGTVAAAAAVKAILIKLVVMYALKLALQFVYEQIDSPEMRALAAAAIVAVALYAGGGFDTLGDTALSAVTLTTTVTNAYTSAVMEEVAEDMYDLEDKYSKRMEEIEEGRVAPVAHADLIQGFAREDDIPQYITGVDAFIYAGSNSLQTNYDLCYTIRDFDIFDNTYTRFTGDVATT